MKTTVILIAATALACTNAGSVDNEPLPPGLTIWNNCVFDMNYTGGKATTDDETGEGYINWGKYNAYFEYFNNTEHYYPRKISFTSGEDGPNPRKLNLTFSVEDGNIKYTFSDVAKEPIIGGHAISVFREDDDKCAKEFMVKEGKENPSFVGNCTADKDIIVTFCGDQGH